METSSQGNMSSFSSPSAQPVYQQYGQFHGASPQMHLAGPPPGMGQYLPQTGIAPMAIMSQPQSNISSDGLPSMGFLNDMGLGNFDLTSNFGSERATQVVPFRTQHRPELPQPPMPKKGRTTKATRKNRTGLRRAKSN